MATLSRLGLSIVAFGATMSVLRAQPGDVDSRFNSQPGSDSAVMAVAQQLDGRLVIAGAFTNVNGAPHAGVARLNSDGSVDSGFTASIAGVPGGSPMRINHAVVRIDGRIIVAGYFSTVNGTSHPNLVQLLSNGNTDASFSNTTSTFVAALAIQPSDGKLLIAHNDMVAQQFYVQRLNLDGSIDSTFASAASAADGQINALAVQPDGNILVGGTFQTIGGLSIQSLARISSTGVVDPSFSSQSGPPSEIVAHPDGKVTANGGYGIYGGIARFNADGSKDTSFTPLNMAGTPPIPFVLENDGRITYAGNFAGEGEVNNFGSNWNGAVGLLRANADGSNDSSFNPVASVGVSNATFPASVSQILARADGGDIVAGAFNEADGTLNDLAFPPTYTGGSSRNNVVLLTGSYPAITSAVSVTAQVGQFFSFQVSATNNPTSFSAINLPPGIIINGTSGLIAGIPTAAGTFTTTVSATNDIGTSAAALSVTATAAAPPAPGITSTLNASAQVGVLFSYQIAATNSPISYGTSGLPTGLSVSSQGLISGVPSAAGTYAVTLFATNSGGTGTSQLNLTIAPAPVSAPVLTGAVNATGKVGELFAYKITATNAPISFDASELPLGLSVDTGSGLISGTPTQSGIFSIAVSARNAGGTGTASLILTISPPLPIVTLIATKPSATLGTGETGQFTLILSAPQASEVVVYFAIKGTAGNGEDYSLISGSKKFKAGKTSKSVNIVPFGSLDGALKKTVKLTLLPGGGYTVGTFSPAKVKLLAGQ